MADLVRSDDLLTPKQEQAIAALVCEGAIRRAARRAEVADRTLYRWLAQPEFRARYDHVRREIAAYGLAVAQEGVARAFRTLRQEQKSDRKSGDRTRAANYFLRNALKGIEEVDLIDQIQKLREEIRAIREGDIGKTGESR